MKPHKSWFAKATNDLRSSKRLSDESDPILDTAAYHTQQCAEKSLKGFLAYKNKPLLKTHDLTQLIDHCVEINSEFEKLYDMVEQLNPYSTAFRYPGYFYEPEYIEIQTAIDYAERILLFVKQIVEREG